VPVIRLLACASVFRAVIALFTASCRIEGRAERILAIQAGIFAMVVGLTVTLGKARGIDGVALAWLVANAVAGCAAAPRVLRILKSAKAPAERDARLAGG
jgi:Na+-driven multidrug efflux pump